MERQFDRTSKGSLPGGDRRGVSGAGAGHYSIRTASGYPLNRRAGAGELENATAEHIRDDDNTLRSRPEATNSAGLSVETIEPHNINVDIRQKWSLEEVRELIFCYFKAKSQGVGYIKRLEKLFKDRNPNSSKIKKLTGTTLSNQARSIISRKIISDEIINEIKIRAENSVINNINEQTQHNTQTTITTNIQRTETQSTTITTIDNSSNNPTEVSVPHEDSRRKWSQLELCELMFCYFKVRAQGPGYVKRLETLFKQRNINNPKTQKMTGQLLSNQARRVLTYKDLTDEKLRDIRIEAEQTNNNNSNLYPLQTEETSNPVNFDECPLNYAIQENNGENIQELPDPINTQLDAIIENQISQTFTQAQVRTYTEVHSRDTQPNAMDNTLEYTTNLEHNLHDQNIIEHVEADNLQNNINKIVNDFLQNLSETKETAIENRKSLPKPNFNKTFFDNLNNINKYLPSVLQTQETLRDINDVIYAAAKTLIILNNQKPYTQQKSGRTMKEPPWKMRIKKKIEEARKELGRLTESKNNNTGHKKRNLINNLYDKYHIFNEQDLNYVIEVLKQKIKLYAGRIKRYEEINNRKKQNSHFKENQHKFYRTLGNKTNNPQNIPNKQDIHSFWSQILSQPKQFNINASWIKEIENNPQFITDNNTNTFECINIEMLKYAIKKTHNWKTPGIDKIQNFYIKYFTSAHKYIAKTFNKIFKGTEETEEWFTTGQVILIPKTNNNTDNPKNWRPIACLPTMYKLLTSIISDQLYLHCEQNKILAVEQRGCRRGTRGCKDHLMLNKAILEDAYHAKKNLSMCWIDYQKAFDSISHEWLLKVLTLYRCPDAIISFLKTVMMKWKVIMSAHGEKTTVVTDPINIKCGLFQGDSLSPLLFCLAINPLSQVLNKYANKGYQLKNNTNINHLLYMDDLKLYAKTKNNLETFIHTVEIFTNDIGMKFGLEKCNILHIIEGRKVRNQTEGQLLLSGEEFLYLKDNEAYKYLGIHESGKLNHQEIRHQITKEYFKRTKKILNTHLSARNTIKAINTYATPVLLYSFGIINYKDRDIKAIDVKTRKLLALKKAHKQKAEVERLYLPVEEGGRGLLNIESLYKTQIIKYSQYLNSAGDYLIKAVNEHDKNINKYSININVKEYIKEIGLNIKDNITDIDIKKAIIKKKILTWKSKPLRTQFYKQVLEKDNIDKKLSFNWLKKQLISPILEATVFAIQDQSIITKQFERDIMKKPIDGKCRVCSAKDETIQHIVSGCEKLAGTLYVQRHNNIVQYIYWALSKKHNFDTNQFWWKDTLTQPEVKENDTAKLMWEMPVQTDVQVNHNRPDIIYIDKKQNTTYLIDVTIPTDYNIGTKEMEKITKYHLLKKEITRLWKTKTTIIPIVIGATGMVAKSIARYCDILDAKLDPTIMQKQVAIHTSTIVSKVLGDNVSLESAVPSP